MPQMDSEILPPLPFGCVVPVKILIFDIKTIQNEIQKYFWS
jgi:hypothetical protein